MIEGSVSIPLTNGSGSGRPKNMWIRIRNTDKNTYLGTKAILKGWKSGSFVKILVNFFAPGSGSGFPKRIQIQEFILMRIRIRNTVTVVKLYVGRPVKWQRMWSLTDLLIYRTTESTFLLGLTPACLQGRLAGPQCGPAIGWDTRDCHLPDSASGPLHFHIHHSFPSSHPPAPLPVIQNVD